MKEALVLPLTGEVIRTMLTIRGVTLTAVANRAGVTVGRVSQVLRKGGRSVPVEEALAAVLELDVDRVRRALARKRPPKRSQAPSGKPEEPAAAQVSRPTGTAVHNP